MIYAMGSFKQNLKNAGLTFWYVLTSLGLAISTVALASPIIYRILLGISPLHLQVGLTADRLMENYNAIMRYLIDPRVAQLSMPDFTSSVNGLQHFEEVKLLIQLLLVVTLILTFVTIITITVIRQLKYKQAFLKTYLYGALLLPFMAIFIILVAFDKVFVWFHLLLFNNDYWLFNPLTDPIINVLPQNFFMLLFILIIFLYELYLLIFIKLIRKKI